jgi:PEP-CTERM motif
MLMNGLAWSIALGQGSWTVPRGMMALPLIVALALTGSTAPARADLTINATYDPSMAAVAGAEASIAAAISNITSSISSPNNITVSIYFQSVSTGLGESNTTTYNETYYDYYNNLKAVATSPTQLTALASLVGGAPTSESSVNPATGTNMMSLTSAEARNVGFSSDVAGAGPGGAYDSVISLNTSLTSPPNSLNGSTYSLQSVATHEIDEVLGIGGSGSTIGSGSGSPAGDLDLFRYSSAGVLSYTTDTTATPYFSINGGNTPLTYFNQAGNGSDYGDWASSAVPQVQDAFGTPGSSPTLGTNELTAFNVIGYSVSVPEPTSVLMVGVGLALTAWKFGPRKPARTPAPV